MGEAKINHHYSAGGVVVGPGNKIVIVNQNHDSWSLPKGHLDEGEDELAAATREIYEETGIQDITVIEELGSYTRSTIAKGGLGDDPTDKKTITLFLCITNQSELNPIDTDNPMAEWLEISEVADRLTHTKDKEFFHSITPRLLRFLHENV